MSGVALTARGLALAGRLERTDLALESGCLTLLVGPNGAGKTSLLHRLSGIGQGEGMTMLGDEELQRMPPARRIGRIAFLPANREIAWSLIARDLVALGLGDRPRAAAIDEALESLDALQFADRRLDQLSTGERARILLARALVARPSVLLLDEPAAHLDPARQIAIFERLRIETERGAAVLASVHDLSLARNFADRILVMQRGAIVADGPAQVALAPEIVAMVFGVSWDDGKGWVRSSA